MHLGTSLRLEPECIDDCGEVGMMMNGRMRMRMDRGFAFCFSQSTGEEPPRGRSDGRLIHEEGSNAQTPRFLNFHFFLARIIITGSIRSNLPRWKLSLASYCKPGRLDRSTSCKLVANSFGRAVPDFLHCSSSPAQQPLQHGIPQLESPVPPPPWSAVDR